MPSSSKRQPKTVSFIEGIFFTFFSLFEFCPQAVQPRQILQPFLVYAENLVTFLSHTFLAYSKHRTAKERRRNTSRYGKQYFQRIFVYGCCDISRQCEEKVIRSRSLWGFSVTFILPDTRSLSSGRTQLRARDCKIGPFRLNAFLHPCGETTAKLC